MHKDKGKVFGVVCGLGPCCRLSNCQKRQSKKSTHTVCQGMAVYLTLSSAACHPSHSGKKLLLVSISSKHDFFSTYSSIHHDFFAWDRAVQVHLQNIFFFPHLFMLPTEGAADGWRISVSVWEGSISTFALY